MLPVRFEVSLRFFFFGIALTLAGCGGSPSSPTSPKALDARSVAPSTQSMATETNAEVAQGDESLDAAVGDQAGAKARLPSDDSSILGSREVPNKDQQSAPKELIASQPSVTQTAVVPAIPAPTADQLKSWPVDLFEPLQLLSCRDGGKAGLLTNVEVVGDGGLYALAGSKLTKWSLDNEVPEEDFSDPANQQLIKSLAASADGKWLASGDSKGNLQIWELPECKLRVSKKIYPSGVAHLSISPDSREIATSSYEGEITIWDAAQLTPKNTIKVANQALQRILYVAADRIAVAAEDTTLWNTQTGMLDRRLSAGGYESTLALAPDGKRFVYGDDSKLQLWNIQDAKVESTIAGSFGHNDLADFSDDGLRLVTTSKFLIQIWDVSNGRLLQVIDTFGWETVGVRWLPKSLLLIASENGRVRFWGTAAAATEQSWKPMHPQLELPNVESGESACPAQLMQVIDIRSFPKLPGAIPQIVSDTLVNYSAPVTMNEAKVFYEHFLTREGWERQTSAVVGPDGALYEKHGFRLSLYLFNSGEGSIQINLNFSGNVDLRHLPKFEANPPEMVFDSEDSVQYRIKGDLLQLETNLLRKFHEAGWTSYARLNSSKHEEVDSRDLLFVQGATTLRVSIQRPPVDPSSYQVSYGKLLTAKSLPIPKDAGFVEFDGSTEPFLVASTEMTLQQTQKFFETEMAAQGWLRRDSDKQFTEKSGSMEFIRGQCDATIVLESLPTSRTQIRVGKGLENSSWQLRKVVAVNPDFSSSGLEAADFPGLNGWAITKYDSDAMQIEFLASDATTFAVEDAYTEALQRLGWKADGSGVKSDDYLLASFSKGKAELTLRARLAGKSVKGSISGSGLLWSKPLPVEKQVISYEAWLRTNRHPASLDLIDEYISQMNEIVAAKSSLRPTVPK